MIWFGMTMMTIGFGLFINFDVHSSWAKIIIYQIIAGIGVGPNFQAPLIALQSLVPVSLLPTICILVHTDNLHRNATSRLQPQHSDLLATLVPPSR